MRNDRRTAGGYGSRAAATEETACAEFYLAAPRREVWARRAPPLRLTAPSSRTAPQAPMTLMAMTERLDKFRGESRFTTWASKFVIFNVASKMSRHF